MTDTKEPRGGPISLFSTDLDGTVIGKPDATLCFKHAWEAIPEERRPVLCFNSGRLLDHTMELLRNSDLPDPEYLICGMGTLIYDFHEKKILKEFSSTLTSGWDKDKVRDILLRHPKSRNSRSGISTGLNPAGISMTRNLRK